MKQVLVAMALLLPCCGGSDDFESKPVDVSGSYTVNVTTKANGCQFPNWTEGAQTSGVSLTMTQNDKDVTGTIEGLVGAYVKLLLGSNTFQGSVDGKDVHATSFGTNSFSKAACTYTINLEMDGHLDGDALQGTLTYRPKTNGSPDCGTLDGCTSVADFSGSRPPK